MRSLRRTALMWMAAVIAGVGVAGAGLAYWVALHEANGFMDVQLRQIARSASTTPGSRELPTVRHDPEDDFIVQVWGSDGRVTNVGEHVADVPRQSVPGFATVKAVGTLWRVFTATDNGSTVQVSQQVEVRRELAETAALQVAVPLLALVPIGCLVVYWAMTQALGDLNRLARRVENLPADSRDPIDLANVPSEAAPLVVAMNRLVERLRDSLAQQRKFLSDAAHELRTPLTALDLQITNLGHADAATTPALLADLRQGARRSSVLVDQLLRMARLDALADVMERHDLDLGAVLLEAIADHVALAESRSIDLGLVASQVTPLVGNGRELRIMLGNLIDNAVKYTPAGGTVDVELSYDASRFAIEIRDSGPGIDPELTTRVFDRFFRAADADIEGSGLGLAVAQAIAARHGMSICIANRQDRSGLRVTVEGPAGSSAIPGGGHAAHASSGPSDAKPNESITPSNKGARYEDQAKYNADIA